MWCLLQTYNGTKSHVSIVDAFTVMSPLIIWLGEMLILFRKKNPLFVLASIKQGFPSESLSGITFIITYVSLNFRITFLFCFAFCLVYINIFYSYNTLTRDMTKIYALAPAALVRIFLLYPK